jgi:F-type H+-transporting ATPase subunit gamma
MHKGSVDFITLGKKGRDAMFRMGYKITADFSGLKKFDFNFVWPMISMAMNSFMKGDTDRVILAYSKFINTLTQKPMFQPLLPLTQENLLDIVEGIVGKDHPVQKKYDYKFEPEAPSVLKSLLPKLTEMQIFKAVLESQASEQSARMAAMKNATDAADALAKQ